MSRISDTFTRLKGEGRAALMPYITAGHPTLPATEALLFALEESGADMIELGIPYSDPLADGPTVQRAGQIALQNGATIPRIHAMMRRVREQGLSIPVLYMVYYNCVFRHGEERFLDEAAASGIDGLIIPDLPLEEAEEVEGLAAERGLDLVYLLAPTSTPERIAEAGRRSRGFIYCVSLTGVTGARIGCRRQSNRCCAAWEAHFPSFGRWVRYLPARACGDRGETGGRCDRGQRLGGTHRRSSRRDRGRQPCCRLHSVAAPCGRSSAVPLRQRGMRDG